MPMILYNQVMAQKNQRRSLPPKYDNLSYQTATESENEKLNIHATSQAVWQSNFNTGGMALVNPLLYRPSPYGGVNFKAQLPYTMGQLF